MSRQITLIAGAPQEFYEVGDFVRILAATDPLTIEFYSAGREIAEAVNVSKGYAEKFDLGTFDRVRLTSATTQAVQFVTRLGNVVQYDAAPVGDTAIVSSVPLALDTPTTNILTRPPVTSGFWASSATLSAGQVLTIFSAAGNTNGALIHEMEARDSSATEVQQAFIAKATAPANVVDGEVLAAAGVTAAPTGGVYIGIKRHGPVRIAGGLGLYFITAQAGGSFGLRNLRYTML